VCFQCFGESSFYCVGDANGFFGGVALHGEATGLGPLANAVVVLIEGEVEELAGVVFIFTS
ncbi:MAG: hypothetical protein PHX54_12525, partial [Lentimicrobiaceae bacterium]|nr:hypothetical protein [Lentimicrobiaceae bacterium]